VQSNNKAEAWKTIILSRSNCDD